VCERQHKPVTNLGSCEAIGVILETPDGAAEIRQCTVVRHVPGRSSKPASLSHGEMEEGDGVQQGRPVRRPRAALVHGVKVTGQGQRSSCLPVRRPRPALVHASRS